MSSTILCIGDLHLTLNNFDKKQEKIKKKIQQLKVTKIILLGDTVDESYEELSNLGFKKFLSKLSKFIYFLKEHAQEIIITPGNHDDEFFKVYGSKFHIKISHTHIEHINTQNYLFLHGHQFDSRIFVHRCVRFLGIKKNLRKKLKKPSYYFDNSFQSRQKAALRYTKRLISEKECNIILGHFEEEKKYHVENRKFILLPTLHSGDAKILAIRDKSMAFI